jgi:hypothetical protein
VLKASGVETGTPTLSKGQVPRNHTQDGPALKTQGRPRGSQNPSQKGSGAPCVWGAGRGQQQYLTLIQANPDTCSTATRLEELDALFWRKHRADIIGLQEVRRLWDNRSGTTCNGGRYTLFHTAATPDSNLGVGIMVRTQLVPTIMSLKLLGPRLLIAKFRGEQRNLTVTVAHAPTAAATEEDRTQFYELMDDSATTSTSSMDTHVVLIDANAGPGQSRDGWDKIMGPHGVPFPRDVNTDPNCVAFSKYCYDHDLCIGHTWFAHKKSHKYTFYPNSAHLGPPKDIDHVLIDGRSSSCLEDVRTDRGLPTQGRPA